MGYNLFTFLQRRRILLKYWRGYLIGGIIAFIAYGINLLATKYTTLVDMFYPYVSRMIQNFLAQWSSNAVFCVWQMILVVLAVGVVATGVLMIVLRWNPIQWFGWVLTAASILFFLHTGIYGLNVYSGSVAEDIRLELTEYTLDELKDATIYFRDQANQQATLVPRDASGKLSYPSFQELAEQAGLGYEHLVYEESFSIYAGSTLPVKELGWADRYTAKGILGTTIPLTGEAAVNPQAPAVSLPFVMCHEMARRMCIASEADANLSAFLACRANPYAEYRYSAYVMAYWYCYDALMHLDSDDARAAAQEVSSGVSDLMYQDLADYESFFSGSKQGDNFIAATNRLYNKARDEEYIPAGTCDLLVSWHIQEIVLPTYGDQNPNRFDPYDETKVDLSGIVNAKK